MKVRFSPIVAICTCWVALAGCGEGDRSDHGAAVRDSAGIRIVTHSATSEEPRRHLQTDPGWPSEAELSFGELVDLEVTPEGRVALLDRMTAELTVLSPGGEVEARFGGVGEGPGEMSPFGLFRVVATDSTLVVPDIQLQRMTEFSLSGDVVATRSMMDFDGAGLGYAIDWRTYAAGGFVFRVLSGSGDAVLRIGEGAPDTLYARDLPMRRPGLVLAPSLVWDAAPDGRVALARSDRAELRLWDPSTGTYTWISRGEETRRPLTDADIRHLEELVRADAEAGGAGPGELQAMLEGLEFPDHAPALTAVYVSADGSYWVQRARAVQQMGRGALRVGSVEEVGSSHWEVLDSDGVFRELVALPEGFTPRRFAGPWIYGILEDELGVQTPARVPGGW